MVEGIGIMTILGTLTTATVGYTTPLDCYIGLAGGGTSQVIRVENPVGTLGCQYDINRVRLFAEHISSPSVGDDHPGANHAGVKYVDDTGLYAGVSVGLQSDQLDGNPLVMAGMEHEITDNLTVYAEYLTSVEELDGGLAHGGLKLIL